MELNIDEALRYLGAGRQAPPELRQEAEEVFFGGISVSV